MKTKLDNRKGLSTVITTLIILVVAVLLAGVVTYYATNVVMTRTTQEEVRIRKPHVWVEEGDNAYAALMVQNLGGRDVLLDKVTIRGVDCPWGPTTVEVKGEQLGIGDGVITLFNMSNFPVHAGSYTIYVDSVAKAETTDYTFIGSTGVVTFLAAPLIGEVVTADYSYTNVMVKYVIISAGLDVSADFKLMEEVSGEVFAQIGTVPADAAGWLTPTTDIPLKSSDSILFYIMDPTNIALNDVGTTISVTVFTSNAQWIVETVVQAAEID